MQSTRYTKVNVFSVVILEIHNLFISVFSVCWPRLFVVVVVVAVVFCSLSACLDDFSQFIVSLLLTESVVPGSGITLYIALKSL